MTVKELIRKLQTVDQYREVILQKDSEGNGYSPLSGTEHRLSYEAENSWSGEVNDNGSGLPCVVLFPVN